MKTRELNRLKQLLEKYKAEYHSKEADRLIEQMNDKGNSLSRCGRNPKYSEQTIALIHRLHSQNLKIREIAAQTGCSIGYVQMTIHKQKETLNELPVPVSPNRTEHNGSVL